MKTNRTLSTPSVIAPDLSYAIVAAFYRVYNALGPGLAETLYKRALEIVLREYGLLVDREYPVPVFFEGQQIGFHRLDLLVQKKIIVEVKSTEVVVPAFKRQLRNYLGISRLKLGILLHFGSKAQFYRIVGPKRPRVDSSPFVEFASVSSSGRATNQTSVGE